MFWPAPPRLKPATVNSPSTASFSSTRKCCSTFFSTSIVRSCVAPAGSTAWTSTIPWSSSGRKALGIRTSSTPSTATAAT